jgi:hypothetical protein
MDRQPTPEQQALLNLYAQLLKLSDDTTVAGRFILLGTDGAIVANGTLTASDIDAATTALTLFNEAKAATEEATRPTPDSVPAVALDPALENQLEEYCIGLDAEFLMQLAEQDPNAAVAAFDEITAQWDGEL